MKVLLKIVDGLIAPQLPDDAVKFVNQQVVEYGAESYLFADYLGDLSITSDADVSVYQSSLLVDEIKIAIKQKASQLITEIEASWRMTRARDNAVIKGDYAELDLLLAQKEAIRVASNQAEIDIASLTHEQLEQYQFNVDLSVVQPLPVTRITVGSFWSRLTVAEYTAVNAAAQGSDNLAKSLTELNGRTHVDVTLPALVEQMQGLEQNKILGTVIDNAFATRTDEVLRAGTHDEAYRGA